MPVLRSPVKVMLGVAAAPSAELMTPVVVTVWLPKSGLILVPAMAAEALMSAFRMVPSRIIVLVTVPVSVVLTTVPVPTGCTATNALPLKTFSIGLAALVSSHASPLLLPA
jgi:hypothetical protein